MGNITFLGVEGSGKTVLTMALVNLFKAHEAEGWFLRPETRSAFRFVEQVPPVLEPGSLPHQTTELRHLAMSVVKDGEVQRVFDILDYPGEIYRLAFLDGQDSEDPETFQARVAANQEEISSLLSHLIGSERIFVLFNLADAQDIAHNAKNLDAVWVTNACIDFLLRQPSHPEVTLLLTQFDLYGDLNDPAIDVRRVVRETLPLIANNFPNLDIQAVSALGPASGPFGLDTIVAPCMKAAPAVRAYCELDYRAMVGDFLEKTKGFATAPAEPLFSATQQAAQVTAGRIAQIRQAGIWFLGQMFSEADLRHVEETLQDWDSLAAKYQIYGQSFCTSETTLPAFTPKTEVGGEWLALCRKAYEAFVAEQQRQAEVRAKQETEQLCAALDAFLNKAKAFASKPTATAHTAAQQATNAFAEGLKHFRQVSVNFPKPAFSEAQLLQMEALSQDWAALAKQYQTHGQAFCTTEATLPTFTPQTEVGGEWLVLCRKAYETFLVEQQRQAELEAGVRRIRELGLAIVLALVLGFLPLLACCLSWRCPVVLGWTLFPWRWLISGLEAIGSPGAYRDLPYAVNGTLVGSLVSFLMGYLWLMFGSLFLVSGILGVKRLKDLWRQAEKRRKIVTILGGVVTLWLVLFTVLLA